MDAISKLVARLKRSALPPEISRSQDQRQSGQCGETNTECQNQKTLAHFTDDTCGLSAATASPDWLLARDAYLNHIMICRQCHAPTERHCADGGALRANYRAQSMKVAPSA